MHFHPQIWHNYNIYTAIIKSVQAWDAHTLITNGAEGFTSKHLDPLGVCHP